MLWLYIVLYAVLNHAYGVHIASCVKLVVLLLDDFLLPYLLPYSVDIRVSNQSKQSIRLQNRQLKSNAGLQQVQRALSFILFIWCNAMFNSCCEVRA